MSASPFYSAPGLNVETYDERFESRGSPVEGDVDFYLRLAGETGGPVLELGAGTGRVSWPLTEAGLEVVGLDLSPAMIERARTKGAGYAAATRVRARFVQADMADFALERRFPLAIVPFRGFQSLLTAEAQRRSLASIRRHLLPGGRLVLDLFDPRLDWCHPTGVVPPDAEGVVQRRRELRHPKTGRAVSVEVVSRATDPLRQVVTEVWRFTEREASGAIVRREEETLSLRWSHRQEMRYLLELSGYDIEAELSDFSGAPPAYGKEQVWLARRRD